ncbi:ParA family protein (plasmid) [Tistrella mobilis]|jgi:chromosome partitioning protein|uniref:Chromosome partitioning protein ParA n=1 Tax=Tistrella mobilis TaxID=171437 RepID=A0A162KLM0_9PROT|nr:ParA family protein [Tistrella mobilis]KYO51564.1 chromosome partitioning protein ParA [Tistrella mobilis]
MPVIALANSKGGVGKSTTALVLAQVFAAQGAGVTLLDADPNQPLGAWAARDPERVPALLRVVPDVTEENILDHIDSAAARDPFVIVDLEGTANMAVSYAIGRADLVLIPMRGSQLDADQGARVIKVIARQAQAFRRTIPYAVLFTCTSVLRGRDFRHIAASLQDAGIPILPAEMVERAAFRAIMQIGGTIYDLGPGDVANPEAAIENAEAVAAAVVDYLKGHVLKGEGA